MAAPSRSAVERVPLLHQHTNPPSAPHDANGAVEEGGGAESLLFKSPRKNIAVAAATVVVAFLGLAAFSGLARDGPHTRAVGVAAATDVSVGGRGGDDDAGPASRSKMEATTGSDQRPADTPSSALSTYPDTGPGGAVPLGMSALELHVWHRKQDLVLADHDRLFSPREEEMEHRTHEIPIFIMALDSPGEDAKVKQAQDAIARWLRYPDAESLRRAKLVERTPGVNAYAWPKTIDVANFAVKSIEEVLAARKTPPRQRLASLYYIGVLGQAQNDQNKGHLPQANVALAHHIGCLFGHMYQWQLAKERGNEHTIIMESDGLWYLSVPPVSFQDFADRLPKDYDVLILNHAGAGPGPLRDTFVGRNMRRPEEGGGRQKYQMFEWDRETYQAGLQAYMVSKKFVNEIWHKIVWNGGADMIDAWLLGRMCGAKDPSRSDGQNYLTCYHANKFMSEKAMLNPEAWVPHLAALGARGRVPVVTPGPGGAKAAKAAKAATGATGAAGATGATGTTGRRGRRRQQPSESPRGAPPPRRSAPAPAPPKLKSVRRASTRLIRSPPSPLSHSGTPRRLGGSALPRMTSRRWTRLRSPTRIRTRRREGGREDEPPQPPAPSRFFFKDYS